MCGAGNVASAQGGAAAAEAAAVSYISIDDDDDEAHQNVEAVILKFPRHITGETDCGGQTEMPSTAAKFPHSSLIMTHVAVLNGRQIRCGSET